MPMVIGVVVVVALVTATMVQDAPADDLSFLGVPVAPETLVAGAALYAARCASCHGAQLEGQPDWKRRLGSGRMSAPPHDVSGHTWHHSDQDLFAITKGGFAAVLAEYESDIPAFGELLSDEDITAVLAYIKSTWPERQRSFQAKVTAGAMAESNP